MSVAVANYPEVTDELIDGYEDLLSQGEEGPRPAGRTSLSEWFLISNGASSGSSGYPGGTIPYISSGETYNGITEFVISPEEERYDSPHVTVSAFGPARIQPWRFCARGNGGSAVRVLKPKFAMTLAELIWIVGQINAQRWRFHYGRMATMDAHSWRLIPRCLLFQMSWDWKLAYATFEEASAYWRRGKAEEPRSSNASSTWRKRGGASAALHRQSRSWRCTARTSKLSEWGKPSCL